MSHLAKKYLVYRHEINALNQIGAQVQPVAIVEATSYKEATASAGLEQPGIADSNWLMLAPWINCWNNQYFRAKPLSRASRRDVERARNNEEYARRIWDSKRG
jgi:hypothetical protein